MQRQHKTCVGSAQARKHFDRAIARTIRSGTAGIHRAVLSRMLGL
jgi:hypothetical protein